MAASLHVHQIRCKPGWHCTFYGHQPIKQVCRPDAMCPWLPPITSQSWVQSFHSLLFYAGLGKRDPGTGVDVNALLSELMANPMQLHTLRLLLGVQTHPALPPMRPFFPEDCPAPDGGGSSGPGAREGTRAPRVPNAGTALGLEPAAAAGTAAVSQFHWGSIFLLLLRLKHCQSEASI